MNRQFMLSAVKITALCLAVTGNLFAAGAVSPKTVTPASSLMSARQSVPPLCWKISYGSGATSHAAYSKARPQHMGGTGDTFEFMSIENHDFIISGIFSAQSDVPCDKSF